MQKGIEGFAYINHWSRWFWNGFRFLIAFRIGDLSEFKPLKLWKGQNSGFKLINRFWGFRIPQFCPIHPTSLWDDGIELF